MTKWKDILISLSKRQFIQTVITRQEDDSTFVEIEDLGVSRVCKS